MYDVMITCSTSGKETPLGMSVPSPEVWAGVVFESSTHLCRVCGDMHVIDKQNARLEPRRESPFKRRRGDVRSK